MPPARPGTTVIGRIEAVLNDEQRARYRKILGKPFDLATLEPRTGESETARRRRE